MLSPAVEPAPRNARTRNISTVFRITVPGTGSANKTWDVSTKVTAGDSKAPPWNSEDGNALIELGDISVETNVETEFEPQLVNEN